MLVEAMSIQMLEMGGGWVNVLNVGYKYQACVRLRAYNPVS